MTAVVAQTDPGPDLFIWPPKAGLDAPIEIDLPEDPTTGDWAHSPGRPGGLEGDLLGVRAISFGRWAKATGWKADRFGSYCWRCAESVGPYETDGAGCGSCREKALAWDRAVRLGVYAGGVRAAVMELKFGRWRRSGIELGRAMGERLADTMQAGGFEPHEVVIVAVPTSWRRRMGRGIDHTAVLARAAGQRAGVDVVRGLSRRHTPTQVGLSATARALNIRDVFRPTRQLRRMGATPHVRAVVILDDVRTTGATMTAAGRAVRKIVGRKREIWALTALVASDRRGNGAPATGLGEKSGAGREKIAKSFELAV